MALTKDALALRRTGIGASDAGKIVSGDWYDLWAEKTGAKEPEDLSRVFPVQLGIVTEELNLRFAEYKLEKVIGRRGEVCVSKDYPFLRCTLDGFVEGENTVVQAKHVNGFSKIEEIRAKYTPQVSHEMLVTGATSAILSVIIGTNEPVLEIVERDDFFLGEYVEKCRQFWGYVVRNEPPTLGAPMAEPPAPKAMRVVDMTGSNAWASAAADYISAESHAKIFEAAKKDLKAMVEPDVGKAFGHGIVAMRSKAGAVSFKQEKVR